MQGYEKISKEGQTVTGLAFLLSNKFVLPNHAQSRSITTGTAGLPESPTCDQARNSL
jgi:hypothetical protein